MKFFGCRQCSRIFPDMVNFVKHWKSVHETPEDQKNYGEAEIIRDPGTGHYNSDLYMDLVPDDLTSTIAIDTSGSDSALALPGTSKNCSPVGGTLAITSTTTRRVHPPRGSPTVSGARTTRSGSRVKEAAIIRPEDKKLTPSPNPSPNPQPIRPEVKVKVGSVVVEETDLEKYSEKCVILGEKECKVSLSPLLGERHLIVLKSKIHGRGLFTGSYIRSGEIIIEYAGRVVERDEAMALQRKYDRQGIDNYIMKLGNKLYIDGTLMGNCARYTNNSCNPNCSTNIVTFLGQKKTFIYALRDIDVGEELTYDYMFSGDELVPCNCGAKQCRGALNWNIGKLKIKNMKMLLKNF